MIRIQKNKVRGWERHFTRSQKSIIDFIDRRKFTPLTGSKWIFKHLTHTEFLHHNRKIGASWRSTSLGEKDQAWNLENDFFAIPDQVPNGACILCYTYETRFKMVDESSNDNGRVYSQGYEVGRLVEIWSVIYLTSDRTKTKNQRKSLRSASIDASLKIPTDKPRPSVGSMALTLKSNRYQANVRTSSSSMADFLINDRSRAESWPLQHSWV